MKIDILTLFPDMVLGGLSESIIKRAIDQERVSVRAHQLRDYANNKHRKVDDAPYGGGAGLVMQIEPVKNALEAINKDQTGHVIYFTPKGPPLTQARVNDLAKKDHLILLCGHYEGIDERIITRFVDEEISIGDYVLTGGELAAMVLVDATVRLQDGVLGKAVSHQDESFQNGLLEYPHYTRPEVYDGQGIPDILLSGHHQNIEDWRYAESLKVTKARRPELYQAHIEAVHARKDKKEIKRLNKCLASINQSE